MPLSDSQLAKLKELFKRKAAARDLKDKPIEIVTFSDPGIVGLNRPDGKIQLSSDLAKEKPSSQANTVFHEMQHNVQRQHPETSKYKGVSKQQYGGHVLPENEGHLMTVYKHQSGDDLEDSMQKVARDNLKVGQKEGRDKIKQDIDKASPAQRLVNRLMYGKEGMPKGIDVDKTMDTQRKNIGVEKVKATFEEKLKEALSTKEDDEQKSEYIKRLKERLEAK